MPSPRNIVVARQALIDLILGARMSEQRTLVEPHYTKPGRGRRPLPLNTMLRAYFLQQWFNLSDPAAEDMRYGSESMRH